MFCLADTKALSLRLPHDFAGGVFHLRICTVRKMKPELLTLNGQYVGRAFTKLTETHSSVPINIHLHSFPIKILHLKLDAEHPAIIMFLVSL